MTLFVVFTLSCKQDRCDNLVTYEERFPIFSVDDGEYVFIEYIVYEDVMSVCDCLLLANEGAKDYTKFLEGLDLNSNEFGFHSNYPSYYFCK
jgi:hypothetical protein